MVQEVFQKGFFEMLVIMWFLGVDYDESALKTFQNNHGTATAMKLDLYNHDNITCIVDFLKDNNIENLDVLVGGTSLSRLFICGKNGHKLTKEIFCILLW